MKKLVLVVLMVGLVLTAALLLGDQVKVTSFKVGSPSNQFLVLDCDGEAYLSLDFLRKHRLITEKATYNAKTKKIYWGEADKETLERIKKTGQNKTEGQYPNYPSRQAINALLKDMENQSVRYCFPFVLYVTKQDEVTMRDGIAREHLWRRFGAQTFIRINAVYTFSGDDSRVNQVDAYVEYGSGITMNGSELRFTFIPNNGEWKVMRIERVR